MMVKTSFLFSALLFCLVGCSNPRYVTVAPTTTGGTEKATATCAANFSNGNGCVTWTWEKAFAINKFNSIILKTGRANLADGSFLAEDPDLELAVVLWMPSMGHGSSPVTVERLDRGTYRVSEVFFTMAGDWEIRVQLKAGDDVKSEAILPLSL